MYIDMEYTKNYDFSFVYTCVYMSYTRYIPACTWFIHFHSVSYLEKKILLKVFP
jgi:hypothetical protein